MRVAGRVGLDPMDRGRGSAHDTCTAAAPKPLLNPDPTTLMKRTALILIALTSLAVIGCNKQKAAIDAKTDATKDAINGRKDSVEAAAEDALKQTDANAKVNKANIEAANARVQADLDAEKQKADATAAAEKAKVDAANK